MNRIELVRYVFLMVQEGSFEISKFIEYLKDRNQIDEFKIKDSQECISEKYVWLPEKKYTFLGISLHIECKGDKYYARINQHTIYANALRTLLKSICNSGTENTLKLQLADANYPKRMIHFYKDIRIDTDWSLLEPYKTISYKEKAYFMEKIIEKSDVVFEMNNIFDKIYAFKSSFQPLFYERGNDLIDYLENEPGNAYNQVKDVFSDPYLIAICIKMLKNYISDFQQSRIEFECKNRYIHYSTGSGLGIIIRETESNYTIDIYHPCLWELFHTDKQKEEAIEVDLYDLNRILGLSRLYNSIENIGYSRTEFDANCAYI